MESKYWDYDNALTEMLLETSLTVKEIADDLGFAESLVAQRIKLLGLDWIPKKAREVSRGQAALTQMMRKLLPGEKIVNEYQIGNKLRLDVFCPGYNIAAEYHGKQHFEFNAFFHPTYDDFVRSKERDEDKIKRCEELGIGLLVFRYCDELNEDAVFDRMLTAINESRPELKNAQRPKYSMKNTPQYQELKAKRNAHMRELRKQIRTEHKERERKKKEEYLD